MEVLSVFQREREYNSNNISPLIIETFQSKLSDIDVAYNGNVRGPPIVVTVYSELALDNLLNLLNKNDKLACSIKLKLDIDHDVMQMIINNQKLKNYIDWKSLSKTVDHELIISHPDLPWDDSVLSSRLYLPSPRLMKTKSAKK